MKKKAISRNGLLAIMIISICFSAALAIVLTYTTTERSAQRRAAAVLFDSAKEQAATLTATIAGQYREMESIIPFIAGHIESKASEVEQYLQAFQASTEFSRVTLVDREGAPQFASSPGIADRGYFQEALHGKRGMETVVDRETGRNVAAFAVPCPVDGAIRYVLCGYFYESEFRLLLNSRIYGGQGFSYLLNTKGDVIINCEVENQEISGNYLYSIANAVFSDGKSIERLTALLREHYGCTASFSLEDGVERLVAFQPIDSETLPENDWILCNTVLESALTSEVEADRDNMLLVASIIFLFSLGNIALLMFWERINKNALKDELEKVQIGEEQFRIVARQSNRFVARYSIRRDVLYRDDDAVSLLGGDITCHDPVKTAVESRQVTQESIFPYRRFFASIIDGKSPVTADFQFNLKSGVSRWYRFQSTTQFDSDNRPVTAVISYFDCTQLRERELAYAKWQQELAELSAASSALMEWNLTRDCPEGQSGDLPTSLAGLPNDSFDGNTNAYAREWVHEDERPAYIALLTRERLIGAYHDGVFRDGMEFRELQKSGGYRWLRITIQLVPYPDSQDIKAYLAIRDIDAEKREALAVLARAQRDSLTGIFNRQTFIQRFQDVLAASPTAHHALIMMDIDHFKQINDTLGHDMGDQVLVSIANHARSLLRTTDLIGRLGGDEFVICLPDIPYDAAIEKKAAQICSSLRQDLTGNAVVTVSLGVAVYPRDGEDFSSLYKAADMALYSVKSSGRDNYAFYHKHRKGKADDDVAKLNAPLASTSQKQSTVLLASDFTRESSAIASSLQPSYNVLQAAGEAALAETLKRHQHQITAAVIDCDSPFGEKALRMIRDGLQDFNVSLVALTADSSDEKQKKLLSKGVLLVINKPVDQELLSLRLQLLFSARSQEQSYFQKTYYRLQSNDELRYREVLSVIGTTVYIYDINTRTYQANLLSKQLLPAGENGRFFKQELLERDIVKPEDQKAALAAFNAVVESRSQREAVTLKLKTRAGEWRWFTVQFARMLTEDQHSPKMLITVDDVNDQALASEALRTRAERDALTGLYNRETFFEKAKARLSAHAPGYYTMACLDVNHFKVLNDQYGVDKGDSILIRLAQVAKACLEPLDGLCCRMNADKFAFLYPAALMASPQLAALHQAIRTLDDVIQPLFFSVGRFLVSDLDLPISAMYDRATLAKNAIKGRFDVYTALYNESMRAQLLEEQEIVDHSIEALRQKQFEVWFQPQYNHSTGAMIGAEALVRWRDPNHGLLLPAKFVPVFERNGFIYHLDKYVWEEACRLISQWRQAGRAIPPLSVNVSRYDLFQSGFYETLVGLVKQYEIPVEMLRLEITESAFASSSEQIIQMVERLRGFGFTIEIDDFGSGYSSLNTLNSVPADVIKLDMRFLERSGNTKRGGSILESIVRMTRWLNTPIIAEGVETVEQADYLLSIGCPYVQGYLYARPVPMETFEDMVLKARQEREIVGMETIRSMDNNAFWDPASMETLIFNSYVGGACIFEYTGERMELMRVNQKYAQIIGGDGFTQEEALGVKLPQHINETDRLIFDDAILNAVRTNGESACELHMFDLPGQKKRAYIRMALRVLARAGESYLVYCSVEDVSQEREAELLIIKSSQQLEFLNDVSRGLLSHADPSDAINEMLGKVLNYFHGQRAYVFEFLWDAHVCDNTYEICADGVQPEIDHLKAIPIDDLAFWLKAFESRSYLHIEDIDALTPEREDEKRILAAQGIRRLIAVPLRRDGRMIGFIGVDNPEQNVDYVVQLKALGDYMAVILTRRDLQQRLESSPSVTRG